jgi:toxin ParE1/3/4
MRVRWTPAAAQDLQNIKEYLQENYPHFAQATTVELYDTIRSLKTSPYRGRNGREEGTRELVFTRLPYIAVYRVLEHDVEVLHISHGAQNWP